MKGGNLMSITTPVLSSILRVMKNNFLLTSLKVSSDCSVLCNFSLS